MLFRQENYPPITQLLRRVKATEAKIGFMLMDIVKENNNLKEIEISGLVTLAKKYHIGNKTFSKYLKRSIFPKEGAKNYLKVLYLNEMDIVLIKEMIYLENRYSKFEKKETELVKLLIESLGRTL